MKVNRDRLTEANSPEARRVAALQSRVVRDFKRAALDYLRETEGRDLEAEIPNWTSFTIDTDWRARGTVVVRQYRHDERAPSMLRQTWTINKKNLVRS